MAWCGWTCRRRRACPVMLCGSSCAVFIPWACSPPNPCSRRPGCAACIRSRRAICRCLRRISRCREPPPASRERGREPPVVMTLPGCGSGGRVILHGTSTGGRRRVAARSWPRRGARVRTESSCWTGTRWDWSRRPAPHNSPAGWRTVKARRARMNCGCRRRRSVRGWGRLTGGAVWTPWRCKRAPTAVRPLRVICGKAPGAERTALSIGRICQRVRCCC